jgi:cell division protein FtsB
VPVWTAAIAVLVAAMGIALLDAEAGIETWLDLREEAQISRGRIQALEQEVERLANEIEALDSDALALERAIREDLELARPGEWVVRFSSVSAVSPRRATDLTGPTGPTGGSIAGAPATALLR